MAPKATLRAEAAEFQMVECDNRARPSDHSTAQSDNIIILDIASNTTLRAEATTFEMMECGKHARPAYLCDQPWDRRDKPYIRALLPGEKRGDCICDYHQYPELRRERTSLDLSKVPDKPFRLMDLPAEIRERVYEYALVAPEGVEFCPEPYFFSGLGPKHRRTGDWHDGFDISEKHHVERMEEHAKGTKSLLRVSKQLYKEALPAYFRENEFRFTNITGWVALDFFLYHLGLEKCDMLRKITVCHPDCCHLPTSLRGSMHFGDGSPFINIRGILEPGFKYDTRWFEEKITMDPARVLQKAGKLQQLRLVSPAGTYETFDTIPFDTTCFRKLDITFISLRIEKYPPENGMPLSGNRWEPKDTDVAETMANRYLQKTSNKVKFVDAVIDKYGNY